MLSLVSTILAFSFLMSSVSSDSTLYRWRRFGEQEENFEFEKRPGGLRKPGGEAGAGELERLPRGTTNVSANSTAGDPKDGATSGTPSVAPVSSTLDSNASSASSAHAAAANTSDVITWPSPECAAICNGDHSFPECSGGKVAPLYDHECGCLEKYVCCPMTCEEATPQPCQPGVSFPEETTDCCACKVVNCVACPQPEPLLCNPGCEQHDFKVLQASGCRIPFCRRECPTNKPLGCSTCEEEDIFNNGSRCGCPQNRCVPKACSVTRELPPKPCHTIENSTDSCGCKTTNYEKDNYCSDANQQAEDKKCGGVFLAPKCFDKVVTKVECDCNEAECVEKEEKPVQKFSRLDECPKGHFKKSGLTPCGLDRDICLKCGNFNLDKVACPSDCNSVVTRKDVHGCQIQECERKRCKAFMPSCSVCQQLVLELNPCDCPVAKCVKKCPDLEKSDCPGGLDYSMVQKDVCGCDRVICLENPHQMLGVSIGSYSFSEARAPWVEADAKCQAQGGYLAVIGSKAEERVIRDNQYFSDKNQYWIGAKCEEKGTTNFHWVVDGKKVSFQNVTFPKTGSVLKECNQDEGAVWIHGETEWGTDSLTRKANYVCEYQTESVG